MMIGVLLKTFNVNEPVEPKWTASPEYVATIWAIPVPAGPPVPTWLGRYWTEHLDVVGPIVKRVHTFDGVNLPAPSVDQATVAREGIAADEVSVIVAVQVARAPTTTGELHVEDRLVEWPVVTLWLTIAP